MTNLIQAAQQALEALEAMKAEFRALDLPYGSKAYTQGNDACHSLRAALAEQPAEQEPVAWRDPTNSDPGQGCTYDKAVHEKWPHIYKQPLYTAPQPRREVDLTDEEIDRALDAANVPELPGGYESVELEIARAVIAAYKAKQGEKT